MTTKRTATAIPTRRPVAVRFDDVVHRRRTGVRPSELAPALHRT